MPTITKIGLQKSKNRVNIYLDGKFGFGLDLETFIKSNLKVEQEIDEEEINRILEKGSYQLLLDRLLIFATLRPRSKKEFEIWMKKKKVGDKNKELYFKKLEKLNLVDDAAFARWWIGQRIQFKSKSKKELEYELRCKGIDKETIMKVTNDNAINEIKAIKELIAKNTHKWIRFEKRVAKQKMIAFLARKGFGWDAIKKAMGNNNFEIDG